VAKLGFEFENFFENHNKNKFTIMGRKSGLVVSKLDSGCGFKYHPILDENGVKAMAHQKIKN